MLPTMFFSILVNLCNFLNFLSGNERKKKKGDF
jgi:hypothetical protein